MLHVLRAFALALPIVFVPRLVHARPCSSGNPDEICQERDIFFMPGAQAVFFAPRAASEPFYGGGVQLAPFHWSHNNDHFGPSQGGVFFEASLLQSRSESSTLALYDAGFSLSFERNSSRNFGIPYFGTSFGGTLHKRLPNTGYAYPFVGVHLYWHQNFIFDVDGGYHYPFSNIDLMRGARVQATARLSMW